MSHLYKSVISPVDLCVWEIVSRLELKWESYGEWTIFHDLESSSDIITRRIRWIGPVARMGKRRNAYTFWQEKLKERNHQESLSVHENILLKLMKRNHVDQGRERWLVLVCAVMNYKMLEFFERLRDWCLLKKDSVLANSLVSWSFTSELRL
jgi:hypothetical protein